ncbi:hypothetical protein [Cetobacterium sp. SF1]|uniref:hypothetical protein n=1 Tax=Cetobacterium sp. SF1 TaxID=3417654 RepID=UPI003CF7001B
MAKSTINVLEKLKKDSFKKKESSDLVIEKEYKVTFIEEDFTTNSEVVFSYDSIEDIDARNELLFFEKELIKAKNNYHTTAGKILFEANLKYANNKNGCFYSWLEYLKINKKTSERLINRYKFFQKYCSTKELKDYFETLPLSLTYEISSPNADQILIDAVLNKKIQTRKELINLKKNLISLNISKNKFYYDFEKINKEIYKILNSKASLANYPKELVEKIELLNKEISNLILQIREKD